MNIVVYIKLNFILAEAMLYDQILILKIFLFINLQFIITKFLYQF